MDTPIRTARNTQTATLPARYVRNGQRQQLGPPLRIAFNASRGPRQEATRRPAQSQESHTCNNGERMLSQDSEIRAPPSSPRSADEIWDDGLLRVRVGEDFSTPFSSNETEPIPQEQDLRLLTDPPLGHLGEPRTFSPSVFPKPPQPKELILGPTLDGPAKVAELSKPKAPQQEWPLHDPSEVATSPAKQLTYQKPTGKRRQLPTAWIEASLSQPSELPLPTAAVELPASAREVHPGIISVYRPPTPPQHDFCIPRKPPPIPKAKQAHRPATLSLFPSSPPSANPFVTTNQASATPPSSLRSGSTLVGTPECDANELPTTPTTAVFAQKMADAYRTSGSPGQTSGWYDDEEAIERVGLIERLKARKSGGWKSFVCGCFGN